jgi:hypothetical protein
MRERLNRWLEGLPRTRFGAFGEMPAFRACGVAGFYVALMTALTAAALTGRSLVVMAGLAAVCAVSFFLYTWLRRWIARRESLVLMEHVWFALAASSAALWACGLPISPYLDCVSLALCPFLAAGRCGCLLVGCCHGKPARVGIVYGASFVETGFPRVFAGVRLFPVQALEGIAIAGMGLLLAIALPFAPPGAVFCAFLAIYALLRFATEGLRADPRPHLFGLSQARWMAVAQVGAALWIAGGPLRIPGMIFLAVFLTGALIAGSLRRARRLAGRSHVREVRRLVENGAAMPEINLTSRGVGVAVSRMSGGALHVSLSLSGARAEIPLLCQIAARALPGADPRSARAGHRGVLHVMVPAKQDGNSLTVRGDGLRSAAMYAAASESSPVETYHEPRDPAWYFAAPNGRQGAQ